MIKAYHRTQTYRLDLLAGDKFLPGAPVTHRSYVQSFGIVLAVNGANALILWSRINDAIGSLDDELRRFMLT